MIGDLINTALHKANMRQITLAHQLGISPAALSLIMRHNKWPKLNFDSLCDQIHAFLAEHGVQASEDEMGLDSAIVGNKTVQRGFTMIRKQTLSPQARRKFGLCRELFGNLNHTNDVFLSADLRFVRESLYDAAIHGGLLALYGESGSGKSTLKLDLIERLHDDTGKTVIIEPYVLASAKDSKKTPGLRPTHICEAILHAVAPGSPSYGSPENRFKNMHAKLKESHTAGFRHVVLIEEAHDVPRSTLKALKRFAELSVGFTPLLSIILIGQNELRTIMSEYDAELRELVQRMAFLELRPLDDLEGYVRHRCTRAGVKFEDLFDKDAMPALALRLTGPRAKDGTAGAAMHFPLMVGNVLTAAMNLATELGLPKVTADAVKKAKGE